jgi:hypothetical protein
VTSEVRYAQTVDVYIGYQVLVDPADHVGADDLDRLLAVEARIDPPPRGNPHIADVVLRARRR